MPERPPPNVHPARNARNARNARSVGAAAFVSVAASVLAVVLAAGCDGADDGGGRATGGDTVAAVESAPLPTSARVERVASLEAGRATHVAAGGDGRVWWVQETDDGRDGAFVVSVASAGGGQAAGAGVAGLPEAVGLTSRSAAAAFDDAGRNSGEVPGGGGDGIGTIQSIAALTGGVGHTLAVGRGTSVPLPAGNHAGGGAANRSGGVAGTGRGDALLFYFAGGRGPRTLAGVGRFDPATGRIDVLAGADAVGRASGLGATLALARGTLVPPLPGASGATGTSGAWWLWVRHLDGSAFLRFTPPTGGAAGGTVALDRPFERVVTAAVPGGAPGVELRPGESWGVSAGPGGDLLLTDPLGRAVWRVDSTGTARPWASLAGLPAELTAVRIAPGPDSAGGGRAVVFAADAPVPPTDDPLTRPRELIGLPLPAIVVAERPPPRPTPTDPRPRPGPWRPIARDAIEAPAGYPVYALRLADLVPDPAGSADRPSFYAYDAAGGDLLRVTLRD